MGDLRHIDSESVYVVSLSMSAMPGWAAAQTTIDLVEQQGRYFFPATGRSWPPTPPTYVAFRYRGRLQSIHHVDAYMTTQELSAFFPGAPDASDWDPHFLLTLGPPIRPDHEVRTGPGIVGSARVSVDLDLLLTATTISEAAAASRLRRAG